MKTFRDIDLDAIMVNDMNDTFVMNNVNDTFVNFPNCHILCFTRSPLISLKPLGFSALRFLVW